MDKKIKKVRTPLGLIGIRWYKSKDGTRWIRFGENGERRRIGRGLFLLTRTAAILLIVALLGWNGYKFGMSYASDKMIEQLSDQFVNAEEIERMKQDPAVQQLLLDHADELGKEYIDKLNLPSVPATPVTQGTTPPAKPDAADGSQATTAPDDPSSASEEQGKSRLAVKTKEEALQLLLGKFSMDELKTLANSAKGGLTDQKKVEIKNTLMERLTSEEFEAVKVVVLMELLKKEG